ncbi:MAG TPA: P-loop NTPase fold protein [candidate division Zixibacteria bacterium]|nr:P-loop NTPase fold protein [candidate division Zixibacteria bacterium]
MESFIARPELLKEDCRVEDLLDVTDTVEKYAGFIAGIQRSGILAIVGPYGCGKSTVLYQVEKMLRDRLTWVNFDAWKYPDRRDLWEGFVLDVAEQLGDKEAATADLSGVSKKAQVGWGTGKAIAGVVGLDGVVSGLQEAFTKPPAVRISDIQRIFTDLLNSRGDRIVIVAEDVDRSGPSGTFFLETLSQFLSQPNLKATVLVVAPVGLKDFEERREAYNKCVDCFLEFNPSPPKLDRFVAEAFDRGLFDGEWVHEDAPQIRWTGAARKGQVTTFLNEFVNRQRNFTMREVKLMLRTANEIYGQQASQGLEPDFRVTIAFEAAKHIRVDSGGRVSLFHEIRETRRVPANSLVASFLISMISDRDSIMSRDPVTGEARVITSQTTIVAVPRANGVRDQPSVPWMVFGRHREDKSAGLYITDFYLDY